MRAPGEIHLSEAQPREELGPVLPSKGQVWAQARELRVLSERAMEFAGRGPTADLALALKQFDSMRAVLGEGELRK